VPATSRRTKWQQRLIPEGTEPLLKPNQTYRSVLSLLTLLTPVKKFGDPQLANINQLPVHPVTGL